MAEQTKTRAQTIASKMYRSDDRLAIAAPMPGLEPENIRVDVTEHSVVLHGDLRGTLKGEKEVLLDEWNPGPYHRHVQLPAPVDGDTANVTYHNGIVVVALPLVAKTRLAHVTLDAVSPTHGQRIGNFGHPIRPAHKDPDR